MSLGPVELIVVAFPGSRFTGGILPELERLVANGTINIVDAVLVQKDADGEVTILEIAELGLDHEAAGLAALVRQVESLLSADDVDELMASIEPGSSAAMMVFEHAWAKGFADAVVDSGGVLTTDVRIPRQVVDELLAELASAT